MDEAKHTIAATERGLKKIERRLGIDDIYADLSGQLVNHLQQALKAQYMFHRDKQYVVTNGEVKIVDEFTGRIMEGRRYSEGLHQAIEAKEGVLVREENQTLATITLQNYFRLYDKLSGMTGTALTEDAEFREIYKRPSRLSPPTSPFSVSTTRTWCTAPSRPSTTPLPTTSSDVTPRASRSWWHRLHRKLREAVGRPLPSAVSRTRSSTLASRARGSYRCPGRTLRRRDHRY